MRKSFSFFVFVLVFSISDSFADDMYYTDDGNTACLPTYKLKSILLEYENYKTEYNKLKLDYDALKQVKDLEVKSCYDKCSKELDICRLNCKTADNGGFFSSVNTFLSGVLVGAVVGGVIMVVIFTNK